MGTVITAHLVISCIFNPDNGGIMTERSGEYMADVVYVHCTTHNTHHRMAFLHELHGNFPDVPLEAREVDRSSRSHPESLHLDIVHYSFTENHGQPIGIVDINAVLIGKRKQGVFRYEVLVDGEICHSRALHVNTSDHNKIQKYTKEEPSLLPSTIIHRCGIDASKLTNTYSV